MGCAGQHASRSEAAAAQAATIIAKYQIDETSLPVGDTDRTEAIGQQEPLYEGKTTVMWLLGLANELAKDHGCAAVQYAKDGVTWIHIAGRASDVSIVRYLFAWLRIEIERLSSSEIGRAAKNAFRHGAAIGVIKAMRAARAVETQHAASQGTSAALVLVDRHKQADAHIKRVLGGRWVMRTSYTSDRGARERGEAAGSRLAAKPGINGGGGPLRLGPAR
jgi:hypothetical protein